MWPHPVLPLPNHVSRRKTAAFGMTVRCIDKRLNRISKNKQRLLRRVEGNPSQHGCLESVDKQDACHQVYAEVELAVLLHRLAQAVFDLVSKRLPVVRIVENLRQETPARLLAGCRRAYPFVHFRRAVQSPVRSEAGVLLVEYLLAIPVIAGVADEDQVVSLCLERGGVVEHAVGRRQVVELAGP